MKTIYKYPLSPIGIITLKMPKGSEILSLQLQKNIPCIWAVVNTENEMENRRFTIYGTGHGITDNEILAFIGTFQLGEFVFHVFELLD